MLFRSSDGTIDNGFGFFATSGLGGGVWSSVAGGVASLYVTTGNGNYRSKDLPGDLQTDYARSLLRLDPAKEKFAGHPLADALLTREYRKPFVLPPEKAV